MTVINMKKILVFFFLLGSLHVAAQQTTLPIKETSQPEKRNVHRLAEDYYIPGRFAGKTILVTGGARGIGKWTALRAVKEGANVVIMDWLDKLGKQVADSLNGLQGKGYGQALFVYGNIANDGDSERTIKAAVEKFGKIDYVCLNAGVMDGVFQEILLTIRNKSRCCLLKSRMLRMNTGAMYSKPTLKEHLSPCVPLCARCLPRTMVEQLWW